MSKRIIAFANQKGGVGKTTTCRETAFALGSMGKKILLVGADPQGNLAKGLLEEVKQNGLFNTMTESDYTLTEITENVFILPGDNRLSNLSKSLVGEIDCYTRLKGVLEDEQFSRFDYIFIDCRPAFDTLTINALTACTDVVIPMSTKEYTLQGTNDLLESISKVKRTYNPELKILGIIINCYDPRPVIERDIKDEILDTFGDKVFNIVISKTVNIEKAIEQKVPIVDFKVTGKSNIKKEVILLGQEFLKRLGG